MKQDFQKAKVCRICKSSKLYKFIDLGYMPIPNGFLRKEDTLKAEQRFELACFYCENCSLVHLTQVVNPYIMFSNYLYVTAQAKVMLNNLTNLANQAYREFKLNSRSLVVDIGSNDGSLLATFKDLGARVVGIDPAKNLAKIAIANGIPTEVKLFNLNTANDVKKKYGSASLITALNVIAHIDNLYSLFDGISNLLSDGGHFITEFPYLYDLIKKNEFDTIYHEHLSYFSLRPWNLLVEKFGFEIVDIQKLLIHGGSIRLTHRKKRSRTNPAKKTLNFLLSLENQAGLYNKYTYDQFAKSVKDLKDELISTLQGLKKLNKRIVGYGAAAKGNVLTNYFGIDTKLIDYIVDSTPSKQGLYTPGKHIPIYPESRLLLDKPDFALILAWNFADEIMEKQKQFKRNGGKFIIPIPKVKII